MIVKMQWPIVTTLENPRILIYNESRTFETVLDTTEELKILFGDELKIFAKITIKNQNMDIKELVEDPGW